MNTVSKFSQIVKTLPRPILSCCGFQDLVRVKNSEWGDDEMKPAVPIGTISTKESQTGIWKGKVRQCCFCIFASDFVLAYLVDCEGNGFKIFGFNILLRTTNVLKWKFAYAICTDNGSIWFFLFTHTHTQDLEAPPKYENESSFHFCKNFTNCLRKNVSQEKMMS